MDVIIAWPPRLTVHRLLRELGCVAGIILVDENRFAAITDPITDLSSASTTKEEFVAIGNFRSFIPVSIGSTRDDSRSHLSSARKAGLSQQLFRHNRFKSHSDRIHYFRISCIMLLNAGFFQGSLRVGVMFTFLLFHSFF